MAACRDRDGRPGDCRPPEVDDRAAAAMGSGRAAHECEQEFIMGRSRMIAGVELGGTKSIAIVAVDGKIVEQESFMTGLPSETLPPLTDWLVQRRPNDGFAGLGIATFGPVRLDRSEADFGRIMVTPKPGWTDAALVEPLAARLLCPVSIDTDVNAAAMAEYRWGAAQGFSSVAYITIGTGIGVGVLVNGQPVHGRLHSEAGHLSFRRAPGDAFAGVCAFHADCIEGLLSGPALAARLGQDPATVDAYDERWAHAAYDFAHLLASLLLTLSPQRILIGGGVGLGAPQLLPAAIALLSGLLGGYLPDLDQATLTAIVRTAGLGDRAGPMGAVALALDAVEGSRSDQRP